MKGTPRRNRRLPTPTPPPVAVTCGPERADLDVAPPFVPAAAPRRSSAPPPAAPRRSSAPRAAAPLAHALARLAALAAAAALVVAVVARALAGMPPVAVATWRSLLPLARGVIPAARAAEQRDARAAFGAALPVAQALGADEARDPPRVRRDGYASIRGGVLFTPSTFEPRGASYDLLIHFHGNTQVVRESAEVAGLNAAVAVINLGIGSGPYEAAYGVPGTYEALLADVDRAVAQRGVPSPRLRRVALSAWSAGYGSISTILDVRRGEDPLDALLVLDGIHCGWLAERPDALNALQLAPFVRAARAAAAGEILFTITHSEIDPITYAPTAATATYLLDAAAGRPVARAPALEAPPHIKLRSAEGAVSKRLEKRMVPTTEASVGGLRVRGYRGNTPEHHMAHLLQMAATVLPELSARWNAGSIPEAAPR